MIGRLRFYRRRRMLPFSAAFALVFINGAALGPAVMRPLDGPGTASRQAEPPDTESLACDQWRWLQYERGNGPEQETFVDAAIPPIVKNLRRSPALKAHKIPGGCHEAHAADAPAPQFDFLQRALAANAADLHRLCRLLL